jgi:hypothetical protein
MKLIKVPHIRYKILWRLISSMGGYKNGYINN